MDSDINTIPGVVRLWQMKATEEHPLTPDLVLGAKKKGLNKTAATSMLSKQVPTFDHHALFQCKIDKTVQGYVQPCWVRGVCRQKSQLYKDSTLLHRSMMQGIKQELRGMLPTTAVKDFLVSGDTAVAIRFPEGSGSSSSSSSAPPPILRLFLLPKVVLRPEFAVLIEMQPDDVHQGRACVKSHPDTGVQLITSFDLAAELLGISPRPTSIYLNVLRHTPWFLG